MRRQKKLTGEALAAAQAFGNRLRAAREALDLRLRDTENALEKTTLPPREQKSASTIGRWEAHGIPEEQVDPHLVAELAKLYKKSVADLSPVAAEWLEKHLNAETEQDERPSRWIGQYAGQDIDLTESGPFRADILALA